METSQLLRKRIAVVKQVINAYKNDETLKKYTNRSNKSRIHHIEFSKRKIDEAAMNFYKQHCFEELLDYIQTGNTENIKYFDLKELVQYFNEIEIERDIVEEVVEEAFIA
jgi:hypothetical protein